MMLGTRAIGQWLAMVGERGWRPGGKSVNNRRTVGAEKVVWQTAQQARGNR